MAFKHWISNIASNWDNTGNWSLFTGGSSGAPVPGPADTAIFDSSGIGSCVLDTTMNILGIRMESGYNGIFDQEGYPIFIGDSGARFDDGMFQGETADMSVSGSFYTGLTSFISTEGTLSVRGDFQFEGKESEGGIIAEEIPLTSLDIQNKYITLSSPPLNGKIALNVVKGSSQCEGTDFYIDGFLIRWDGKNLDGLLADGDVLRVIYPTVQISGFVHNGGKVVLWAENNTFYGGGSTFNDLEFLNDDSTKRYRLIEGNSYIDNDLILSGGYLRQGTDSTLHSRGDIVCNPDFGKFSSNHNAFVLMDGTGPQSLTFSSGGILPDYEIDKTSSRPVTAYGTGPIQISGDFTIRDGTFNSNGLDITVGAA